MSSTAAMGPKMKLPQTATLVTWSFLIGSLLMTASGVYFFTLHTTIRSLICDAEACTLTLEDQGSATETRRFPRSHLKQARQVRIRRGEIRDPKNMRKKSQRKLGFSYAISFLKDEGTDATEEIPMAIVDIGRRPSRVAAVKVDEYIREEANELEMIEASGTDWRGVAFLMLGIITLLLTLIAGQFTDPKPRRRNTRKR